MATRTRKSKISTQVENTNQDSMIVLDSDNEDVTTNSVTKITTTSQTVLSEVPCVTSTPTFGSPLSILRTEEKEELAHLNDRFASYIDYVRSLEITKEKLTKKIESISNVDTVDNDAVRHIYEEELMSLRKVVDSLAKERASLEIELKNVHDNAATVQKRLEARDSDVLGLQSKLDILERELSKQRTESELYVNLVQTNDITEKRCAKLSKDLDAEVLLRTDIENQNVTLKEQLEFNERLYGEERIKGGESHIVIEEEEYDTKRVEYESRLAEELRAIREETIDEFEAYKVEFEDAFMLRLTEMQKNNQQSNDSAAKAREEAVSWRSKVDLLEQNLASSAAEMDVMRKRVKDLESLLSYERNEFEEQLKRLHLESDQLRSDLQFRLDEFSNLMSAKIALDQEILMYRKMLESEESRCNLSVRNIDESSFSVLSSRASGKRRRTGENGEFVFAEGDTNGNTATSRRESNKVDVFSNGDIEFSAKPDYTGKSVKIFNHSDKDVCIGGWSLRYSSDSHPDCVYKFHQKLHLKPKSECTIWSGDANASNNSPSDLVMKGSSFVPGRRVTIVLVNQENAEEARCTINRETTRPSLYPRKVASRSTRAPDESKCCTM